MAVDSVYTELVVILILSLFVTYGLQQTILSPLKSVPGPTLAKFTNLWQSFLHHQGKQASVTRQLHDCYGPAVRLGPKHVSLNDPSLIKTVYSLKGDFTKSDRYKAADTKSADGHNIPVIFSAQDEKYRDFLWRPIAKYYTLTNFLTLEPHIDNVVQFMQRRLEQEFCYGKKAGAACNLHKWLSFTTWEVIMMTSFSRMQGFLEKGEDIDGSLADSVWAGDTFTYLGHLPRLERVLRSIFNRPVFDGARKFCVQQIQDRRQLGDGLIHTPPDFIDNFFELQKADPINITNQLITVHAISNVAAGGDTAASTLSGMVYHTITHPHVLKRLQAELDAEVKQTPISWKLATSLPYFNAVMQESIRFHPGTSFCLERVVPQQGLKLPDGRFITPGTIVGMHPWIINRDKPVFGPDADSFVPERWLQKTDEDAEAYNARIIRMKNTVLTFGGGKRRCIGKNLAMLEIVKISSMLFFKFDIELVDKEKMPGLFHGVFVRMIDFNVTLKPREKSLTA
ncbi:MAG: hypothetical protein Q9181_000760 [Wetmoreana brouardii]